MIKISREFFLLLFYKPLNKFIEKNDNFILYIYFIYIWEIFWNYRHLNNITQRLSIKEQSKKKKWLRKGLNGRGIGKKNHITNI